MLFSSRFLSVSGLLGAFALAASPLAVSQLAAQQVQYSSQHRNAERALPQTLSGGTSSVHANLAATRAGISLAVADFDHDGVTDLITGYAVADGGALMLQRGARGATAPGPNERALLAAGQFVAPYVAKSEIISIPVRPDLLETADVSGFGQQDLLVAAKGGSTIYLLAGKGDGTFLPAKAIALDGVVTAVKTWRGPTAANLIVASICGASGCGLQFVGADGKTAGFVATPGPVTSFEFANINGGSVHDVFAVADGKAILIDGDSLLSGDAKIQTVMSDGAAAVAAGYFTYNWDPGMQLAVVGSDAVMHLFSRSALNLHAMTAEEFRARRQAGHPAVHAQVKLTGQAWQEVETTAGFGPGTSAGAPAPVLIHGHMTGNGGDDLVLMAKGQFFQLTHPSVLENGLRKTTAIVTVDSTSDPVTAAVATRVAADARLGIVTLGGVHPQIAQLPVYRTINVSGLTDSATINFGTCTGTTGTTSGTSCTVTTLRSAIAVANSDQAAGNSLGTAKAETINVPSGTITLSACNGGSCTDSNGDVNYHFDVDAATNIIGAGATSSIINANSLDNIFDINSGVVNATIPSFDTYIAGVTLENGTLSNNSYARSSINYQGGLINWAGNNSSDLTIVNALLSAGYNKYNTGGCINVGNIGTTQSDVFELDNSTVENCVTPQSGAGIYGGGFVQLVLKNDLITGNHSLANATSGFSTGVIGNGGGVFDAGGSSAAANIFTDDIFSSNQSTLSGAGLNEEGAFSMSGSTFTNNTAGASGSAPTYGAGFYMAQYGTADSLLTSTFTSNSLTSSGSADGAGVCFELDASPTNALTINYSRFHGNTGGQHTGLGVGCRTNTGTQNATVTATDNWWGCNGPGAGTGCDTAGLTTGNSDNAITLTPYTTLVLLLSSTTPTAGSTFTATGSLGQDSANTVYSQANDAAYAGVAATAGAPGGPGTTAAEAAVPGTAKIVQNGGVTSNSGSVILGVVANPIEYAGVEDTATASSSGFGLASTTVDGCTIKDLSTTPTCNSSTIYNFTVNAPDLSVTSTHTGNFKAGDTGDTYTLTVGNVGTASTSGSVSVVDSLPAGFTATALSGTGWTCTLASVTCTRSDVLASSGTYPAITLTVSVSGSDIGTYNNTATVSGGGETNTNNDTGTDATLVIAPPTISGAFSPTSVAPGAHPTLTFTLTNPNTGTALTGVGLVNNVPAGLTNYSSTGGTCGGTGSASASQETVGNITINASSSCTVTIGLTATGTVIGNITDTSNAVTSSNANNGGTGSATVTVTVTPTQLAFTAGPPTPITAGGNAGSVQVSLEDGSGNVATNNSSTTVTLLVSGPSGYSQNYVTTSSNGVASFNLSGVALTLAQTYTYSASATGLTAAMATEVVNPGPFAALGVTGLPNFTAPLIAGTATVKALDAYGNVVSGFTGTVTLSSTTDPTAAFSPTSYTYVAGDAGSHAFTVTFDTAGTQTVTATSGAITGAETGIVVADAIYILNATDGVARTTDAGVQTNTYGSTSGASQAGGIAFGASGNVWVTQFDTSGFVKYSPTGTVLASGTSIGGLDNPASVFLDGNNQAWFANAGAGSVTLLANAGTAISPAMGYSPGTTTQPTALIVDSSGSVWITDFGGNAVVRLIGAAGPVATPLVTGTINKTLGTKP